MTLDVRTFAEATTAPITIDGEWNTANLKFCVSNVLCARLERDAMTKQLDEPIYDFESMVAAIDEAFVRTLQPVYHNADHARAVAARFERYLRASGAGPVVQQLGFITGLFHDAGHPGKRYREDAVGVEHPELSNEEFAAAAAVEFLGDRLNTTQLAWVYSAIMATSFGQRKGGDPTVNAILDAKPHLVRPYEPLLPHELLLHFADINSASGAEGFRSFMTGGLKLAREVREGEKLSWTTADHVVYAKSQLGFLGFIGMIAGRAVQLFTEPGFADAVKLELDEVKQRVQAVVLAESCIADQS